MRGKDLAWELVALAGVYAFGLWAWFFVTGFDPIFGNLAPEAYQRLPFTRIADFHDSSWWITVVFCAALALQAIWITYYGFLHLFGYGTLWGQGLGFYWHGWCDDEAIANSESAEESHR